MRQPERGRTKMTPQNETTDEAQIVSEPTKEQVEAYFDNSIEAVLGEGSPHREQEWAILQDEGYGRDEVVEGVRISVGGDWDIEGAEIAGVKHDLIVTLAAARENLKHAKTEVVEGAEAKRALRGIVQSIHDDKSGRLLGEDDPSGFTDVCVVIKKYD